LRQLACGVLNRFHNILIACAAAQIAGDSPTNVALGWLGILLKERIRRHQHAGSTEPALQTMLLFEAFLQRVKLPFLEKSLNRKKLRSIRLDGKHRARLDCLSAQDDGASAAVARVAANVCAGQPQRFANEMNEQKPGFYIGFSLLAINFDVYRLLLCHFVSPDRRKLLSSSTLKSAR
jgi:hypothetical protein